MSSYHLFLDDERMPGNVTWVALPNAVYQVVRDYNEFVDTIREHGVPAFVSFDHDLADEHYRVGFEEARALEPWRMQTGESFDYGPEKTGYDCAKWLVDYCADNGVKFPEYAVHSMNPIGGKRIKDYVENAKKHLDI
jgi:hypothetical protein